MSYSAEIPFRQIILHIDETIEGLDANYIASGLHEITGINIIVKGDIFREYSRESTPEEIASTRIADVKSRVFRSPLPVEIDIEKKILAGKNIRGIIYDGWKLSRMMYLPEKNSKYHMIAVTPRLMGTLEKGDARYHIRAVLNSIPSIISTDGIVEGPARPRSYYIGNEGPCDVNYMRYGDERMSKAIISYALQTVMWRITGVPFCSRRGCPLYNSHWQEELIDSQVEGRLCEEHRPKLYLSSR